MHTTYRETIWHKHASFKTFSEKFFGKLLILVHQQKTQLTYQFIIFTCESSYCFQRILRGCQTNNKIGRFYLPTKSPDKNLSCVMQKSTKSPDFFGQDRACSIFDDFVSWLFVYQTTNFVYVAMVIVYNGRQIFTLVTYCACYYRSLDAEKVMQVLFCDLLC